MRRILITGAGGQVASDLVPRLHRHGAQLWFADLLAPENSSGYSVLAAALGSEAPSQLENWTVLDVTDASAMSALLDRVAPDVVYHLATILSSSGEKNPALCWDVNVGGLKAVIDALATVAEKTAKTPRLIWCSSIAAFGPHPDDSCFLDQVTNDTAMLPQTMYGVTKVTGELLGAYAAHHSRGARRVDFRAVRFPGLLNETPPGGGTSDFANEMYFAAALNSPPESSSFVGESTRIPWMYMPDAMRVLLEIADVDEKRLTRRTYNVAGFSATAAEIEASIRRVVPEFKVTYAPVAWREAIARSWPQEIDDAPARADWNWHHEYDLDAMTDDLIATIRRTQRV